MNIAARQNIIRLRSHFFALLSVVVWGGTFISTKVLLLSLNSYQILLYRCLIAFIVLSIIEKKVPHTLSIKNEVYYFIASMCGVTMYFIFENTALTKTFASNASLIVTIAPILSVFFVSCFSSKNKFHIKTIWGFVLSFLGVIVVTTNGTMNLHMNPVGDLLALLAAISWAFFPIVLRLTDKKESTVFKMKKIFLYCIITILVFMYLFEIPIFNSNALTSVNFINLLFLGIIASALCYVFWSKAVFILGVNGTMIYMYFVPLVTIILGSILLQEKITYLMLLGGAFILSGVYLNNKQF